VNTYNKNKLIISAIIIYILSIIVMVISLIGLFVDTDHCEAYCMTFTSFGLIGVITMRTYDSHKLVKR
jgi:uncharacterized membrane protein